MPGSSQIFHEIFYTPQKLRLHVRDLKAFVEGATRLLRRLGWNEHGSKRFFQIPKNLFETNLLAVENSHLLADLVQRVGVLVVRVDFLAALLHLVHGDEHTREEVSHENVHGDE